MKKVLYLEDDTNLGSVLKGALESQNLEVRYLTGSEDVMTVLEVFKPDIVILDVLLREKLDGFDVARLIRKKYSMPILFTSTIDTYQDLKKSFNIDNADFLHKPFRTDDLFLHIKELLNK